MTQRTATNFVVDLAAFVTFVLLTVTGLIERYLLPPGSGHFQSLWGLDRHQWGEIHFWMAVALMGSLTAHIAMHWKWIACVVRGRQTNASGWRVAFGIVGLIGLVGLSLTPFLSDVEQTRERSLEQQQEHQVGSDSGTHSSSLDAINGSLTLAEVEQITGVSAAFILSELGLPPNVSHDQTLGRLRQQHGFEMRVVRQLIRDASKE